MEQSPRTPNNDSPETLGFERQNMVDWFNPSQLINTGIQSVLSSIFGSYADKREIQAALPVDEPYYDFSKRQSTAGEAFWLDYIADLGDGWDSTYTMAWLLARKQLEIGGVSLQRGRVLVMGGDQVYPTASREEYRNRLVGPYGAALPHVAERDAPSLFAIPGNHDWYDGLRSFMRLFCQKRWIGGWRTQQARSYFAIKLPRNWWLFGVDIQLEADIDKPQLDFFREVAEEHMPAGCQVILCTAQPDWVYTATKHSRAYDNLLFFERQVILDHGHRLAVTLTGDLHHYCRYADRGDNNQKITAGGGGAYLVATHDMPEELWLRRAPGESDGDGLKLHRKHSFPDAKTSLRITRGALGLPFKNWSWKLWDFKKWNFGVFLGVVYLAYAWFLQGAGASTKGETFFHLIQDIPATASKLGDVLLLYLQTIQYSGSSLILLVGIVFGLLAFSGANTFLKRVVALFHGLGHILINIIAIWFFADFNAAIERAWPVFPSTFVFGLEMVVIGGIVGGLWMGLYLFISGRFLLMNVNEAFSCQGIADYKNFLRLHIDETGDLTIYPVGVKRVCRQWRFNSNTEGGESWFQPSVEPTTELIEAPIKVKGR